MKNLYVVDETNGVYFVKLKTLENLPFYMPKGSYNVLKARIFNLYYDEYLRYVRKTYHAVLKGKQGYITEFFNQEKDACDLCNELNKRFNNILEHFKM